MKIKYCLLVLLFLQNLQAAVFTIENYTGKEITVEILLNKPWGSKSMSAKIAYGSAYTFDTGPFGVVLGGIKWENGKFFLEQVSIKALSLGLVIRLFKERYEYMYTKDLRSFINASGHPQGEGPISTAY
jgi:hypothetical protein